MIKPDFSQNVVHFTSNEKCKGDGNDDFKDIELLSAKDRLIKILSDKCIKASKMPWTGASAVCFTESTWAGLLPHSKRYSAYGIGFKKKALFDRGGGPAIYLRSDLFNNQKTSSDFDTSILPFITPFSPLYRSKSMIDSDYDLGNCDYSHEREWRVPQDYSFNYRDIMFVIMDTLFDWESFPDKLKESIGRDKIILMNNYKLIEKLWPVHIQ